MRDHARFLAQFFTFWLACHNASLNHMSLSNRYILISAGSTRKVDVMDVSTQRSLQMTMHQWAKYFESDKRDTLLNVISLEVSKTALCQLVSPPNFVSVALIDYKRYKSAGKRPTAVVRGRVRFELACERLLFVFRNFPKIFKEV